MWQIIESGDNLIIYLGVFVLVAMEHVQQLEAGSVEDLVTIPSRHR